MTDERYVLSTDNHERGESRTGARHRTHAGRSKKCTLPSDHMTKKEKEKMNGPVACFQMNKPYTNWKEFLKFPKDIQEEYLRGLVSKYEARKKDIADMFGVHESTISTVFAKRFEHKIYTNGGKRGGAVRREMSEKFKKFIGLDKTDAEQTISMDVPYTDWTKFRQLPEAMQSAYLQNLVDKFGARAPDIAQMFGIKTITLRTVCHAYLTPVKFNGMQKEMDERFRAFITPVKPIEEKPVEAVAEELKPTPASEPEPVAAEPVVVEELKPEMIVYDPKLFAPVYMFTAMTSGKFSAMGHKPEIMQMLDTLLDDKHAYEMSFELNVMSSIVKRGTV